MRLATKPGVVRNAIRYAVAMRLAGCFGALAGLATGCLAALPGAGRLLAEDPGLIFWMAQQLPKTTDLSLQIRTLWLKNLMPYASIGLFAGAALGLILCQMVFIMMQRSNANQPRGN